MSRPRNWTAALLFAVCGAVPLAAAAGGHLHEPWKIATAGFCAGWLFAVAVWEVL